MDELLREIENFGIIKVEFGCKEKERKKKILSSLRKLKESGDDVKVSYVKTLYRYYCMFNNIHHIFFTKYNIIEESKYGLNYFRIYLDSFCDTSKLIITRIITALGNDEPVDPFCNYLMFTHLYSPEQVKEIGNEEIYRRDQEYQKELGLV